MEQHEFKAKDAVKIEDANNITFTVVGPSAMQGMYLVSAFVPATRMTLTDD